jgi:hypothetical protein
VTGQESLQLNIISRKLIQSSKQPNGTSLGTTAQLDIENHVTEEMIMSWNTRKVLQWHATGGDDFLFNIMTNDESWFHQYNPEAEHGKASLHVKAEQYPQPPKL